MKTELFIEYSGEHTDYRKLVDIAREIWKSEGKLMKDLEKLEIYFKPVERTCYYVINGEEKGYFEV